MDYKDIIQGGQQKRGNFVETFILSRKNEKEDLLGLLQYYKCSKWAP